MRKRRWGLLLCWLALPLLAGTLACAFKAIGLSVTAEEGLNYSIPGMRGDPHYSSADVRNAETDFQQMARSGDRWMLAAECGFLVALASGAAGYVLLRPRRKLDTEIEEKAQSTAANALGKEADSFATLRNDNNKVLRNHKQWG